MAISGRLNSGIGTKNNSTVSQRAIAYGKWEEKTESQQTFGFRSQAPMTEFGAVTSSWLTGLGYNLETGEAVATFKGTSQRFFYPMDWETYLKWKASPSKGIWLHNSGYMSDYRKMGKGGSPKSSLPLTTRGGTIGSRSDMSRSMLDTRAKAARTRNEAYKPRKNRYTVSAFSRRHSQQ